MKELRKKCWAKTLAAVLLLAAFTAGLISAALTLLLADRGFYGGDTQSTDEYCAAYVDSGFELLTSYISEIDVSGSGVSLSDVLDTVLAGFEAKNFAFTVRSADGGLLYTSGATDPLLCETEREIERVRYGTERLHSAKYQTQQQLYDQLALLEKNGHIIREYSYEWNSGLAEITYQPRIVYDVFRVTGGVDPSFPSHDNFYLGYRLLKLSASLKTVLPITAAVCLLLSVLLTVFLCSGAGRRAGDDAIHEGLADRLPLGVFLLLTALLALIPLKLTELGGDWFANHVAWAVTAFAAALLLTELLLLGLLLTLCTRFKCRGWWKNTLCFRVGLPLVRLLWRGITALWRNLPLFWKSGLVWLALCAVEWIAFVKRLPTLWIAEKLILTPLLIATVIFLHRLGRGAQRIGSGELNYQIDVSRMPYLLRKHGEQLNSIGDGLQNALAEQMRSERMRAELITNVSHDIRTPLTSIVNYVDLLQKEGLTSERAPQYLEVLERQSARLKKLTEDLIEASKASTGSIAVALEATDLNVVLLQALGEYESRLEEARLETVVKCDTAPMQVRADAKLLWRVLDNLLSNLCKYALPETRVYFRTGSADGKVFAEVKNISAQELDIPPEELMERFVRGDASRNTEGSGLGLSIAESLMRLQGGALRLSVDGDLFKATLLLDAAQP